MKRLRKSNRVSWSPDVSLCQVRLFSSEDCPSAVGSEAQELLQAKTSWILHSNSVDYDDRPPGFEGSSCTNTMTQRLPYIPQIKWKCPTRIVMNANWHVVAGEESKEAGAQNRRELRVLEAVYPRLSAIPPSPSESMDVKEYHNNDDCNTLLIPITPIEEDDEEEEHIRSSMEHLLKPKFPFTEKEPGNEKLPSGISPGGSEADVIAAASAALTAIMKTQEQGSMIDTDLLIKILNDPKIIEGLMSHKETPAKVATVTKESDADTILRPPSDTASGSKQIAHPVPFPISDPSFLSKVPKTGAALSISGSQSVALSAPLSHPEQDKVLKANSGSNPMTLSVPLPTLRSDFKSPPTSTVNSSNSGSQSVPITFSSTGPMLDMLPRLPTSTVPAPISGSQPVALPVPKPMFSSAKVVPARDINYYKDLIKQHGGECEKPKYPNLSGYGNISSYPPNSESAQNLKPKELKSKIQKPCMYFNSSRGCRNGSSCPYQHDPSFQLRASSIVEAQIAKRMKVNRVITGST